MFCIAERLTADRVAFLATGNLAAGLRAIAPELTALPEGISARAAALVEPGPVRELASYALSPDGLQRLGGLG
jgi:hypothetical protein